MNDEQLQEGLQEFLSRASTEFLIKRYEWSEKEKVRLEKRIALEEKMGLAIMTERTKRLLAQWEDELKDAANG